MDIDELRQRKAAELQDRIARRQSEEEALAQFEAQKDALLRKALTPDARSRLATLKLANPHLAEQVEALIVHLVQSGQLKSAVDDTTLRQLLARISGGKRQITIKRK